jgi:hypothetical protein
MCNTRNRRGEEELIGRRKGEKREGEREKTGKVKS